MNTGNTHKKIGKDRACGSRDILTDRQTFVTILSNCSHHQ